MNKYLGKSFAIRRMSRSIRTESPAAIGAVLRNRSRSTPGAAVQAAAAVMSVAASGAAAVLTFKAKRPAKHGGPFAFGVP